MLISFLSASTKCQNAISTSAVTKVTAVVLTRLTLLLEVVRENVRV